MSTINQSIYIAYLEDSSGESTDNNWGQKHTLRTECSGHSTVRPERHADHIQEPLQDKAVGWVYRLGVSLRPVQPFWIPELVCTWLRGGMMHDDTGALAAAASVGIASTAK